MNIAVQPENFDPEISVTQEIVTPEMAGEWLTEANIANRPITSARVDQYALAMKNGEWRINGEFLIFDSVGRLANGQHRLKACIKSGCNFPALVIRGVDPDSWTTMDSGRPRQASDLLGSVGVKNWNRAAGAIQWIIRIKAGKVSTAGFWQRFRASNTEVLTFAMKNMTAVSDSVSAIKGCTFLSSGNLLAALHFLMAESDRERANQFFTDLANGESFAPGDPVHIVREDLIKSKGKKKIPQCEAAAKIIRAWNMRKSGTSTDFKHVRGTIDGAFPAIT